MRAEIERHAEGLGVGDAAAADAAAGFDQRVSHLGGGEAARGGDAGGAGANNHDIDVGIRREHDGGLGQHGGGSGEEGTAIKRRHGIRMIDGRRQIAPMPVARQIS